MTLTHEQDMAVQAAGDIVLTACPGSGKTKTLVFRLLRAIDQVRRGARRVACITYTTAGADEVAVRLRQQGTSGDADYAFIGTIHSFCLQHILVSHYFRVEWLRNGFRIISPDSEEYKEIVRAAFSDAGRPNVSAKDIEDFAGIRINADGRFVGEVLDGSGIYSAALKHYVSRVKSAGLVDFNFLIYLSLALLRKYDFIVDGMASRFAEILVDEFQDTTDIQVELLTLVHKKGLTKIFAVGDECQSIFGFTGARPDLVERFAQAINARTDLHLSGNFRSSARIVEHAEKLMPRTKSMQSVGPNKDYQHIPIWCHAATAANGVVEDFLPAVLGRNISMGETAILAPWWTSLFPIARVLREYGYPAVGPGARPYRRSRLFAPLAEQLCGFVIDSDPKLVVGLERALYETLNNLQSPEAFEAFAFSGRRAIVKMARAAKIAADSAPNLSVWLDEASEAVCEILVQQQFLSSVQAGFLRASAQDVKADIHRNGENPENMQIEDVGLFANARNAIRLSTIHMAKGREYDAVALVDLHDGKIPHFKARTHDKIDEARRLFYVGVTRAKKMLFYITDQQDSRNRPSTFLTNGGLGLTLE